MSVPTILFIDTNIFDKISYNFDAASIVAFKEAIDGKKLTLLMPDPTFREIQRHISGITASVVNTLEHAARKAPYIKKLNSWPLNGTNSNHLNYQIEKIANQELSHFLELFKVIRLKYEGIDLQEIMNWYDWKKPPFSNKKKCEFPDAFAIASIIYYCSRNSDYIAIISMDNDFCEACKEHSHLLLFQSLASYIETLKSKDERVKSIHKTLDSSKDVIRKAIGEQFACSTFIIDADWDGDVEEPELTDFNYLDYHVVGLGENICTVAFEGNVKYDAYVSYDDYETAIWDGGEAYPMHRIKGVIHDTADISGVVKLQMANNAKEIKDIENVILDQSDFTIRSAPEDEWL